MMWLDAVRPSVQDPFEAGAPPLRLGDLRFRALLGEAEWAVLPQAIRRRFSKRLAGGETAVYVGTISETRFSRLGWLLAQLLRLIGGPLPTARDADIAAVVTVTEERATGGQVWTRLYARKHGFPQVIHSAKRFSGRTGLEEHVGYGIGMALKVEVKERALVFRSDGYFLQVFGRRLFLPAWACLGALTVTHAETEPGEFVFGLTIVHPRWGLLISQTAVFREHET
jgi:hypothetical protein